MTTDVPARERTPPITAKPIPWLVDLLGEPSALRALTAEYGSPLHLNHVGPFVDNAAGIASAGADAGVDLGVFFARKANKALCYVRAAIEAGIGIDVASAQELEQALRCGADPARLVVTSAIKTDGLLATCLEHGVLVVADNHDEATRYAALARSAGRRAPIAVRVSNFTFEHERAGPSRFGFDICDRGLLDLVASYHTDLDVRGMHFHLDGYAADDRIGALVETLQFHDRLASSGVDVDFIDIGGGFPVTYTDREDEWNSFWETLDDALIGRRPPITYRNDGYGQLVVDGRVVGPRFAYPHYQCPVGRKWLLDIITASPPGRESGDIALRLTRRRLGLRCEPGRALLDRCGASISTVVHVKSSGDDLLVGLDMNSSNCRTQKSELLTDPIHLPNRAGPNAPCFGYLTGAYCSESDLVTRRRLQFAQPPAHGDLVVFTNTAGYFMHFTESRSHQFQLPKNVHTAPHVDGWTLDDIDQQ